MAIGKPGTLGVSALSAVPIGQFLTGIGLANATRADLEADKYAG